MNLIEGFVKDEIFVDFGSDITFGSEQQNVDFPSRFPTVEFQLMATYGLSQISDRIRKESIKGKSQKTLKSYEIFKIAETTAPVSVFAIFKVPPCLRQRRSQI